MPTRIFCQPKFTAQAGKKTQPLVIISLSVQRWLFTWTVPFNLTNAPSICRWSSGAGRGQRAPGLAGRIVEPRWSAAMRRLAISRVDGAAKRGPKKNETLADR